MDTYTYDQIANRKSPNFFAGILLGSLAGAATMLLFAPQSGRKTRNQIQQKATELRAQALGTVESTVAQVRAKAGELRDTVNNKASELKDQGRDILVEQLDRVSDTAKSGKKALQGKHS